MGKGFFKSIAKGITAPVKFVGKIHRETFRIIDQGLEKANAAIEKTGFNKILGGSSIGVSTSSGSSGGSNVYFKPAGSSNSVGVGLSNSGDASLFVNNNVAVLLTTPKANFITTENVEVEYSDNNITKNETDAVSNALAERDQLLREIYGPGYIPESSLATMSVIAIGSATNQLLHDTWDTANTIANVHLNNNVIIHSMSEAERAGAWNRNQEIYGDVSNAVSNIYANPAIIPAYYANRFEESSNIFSSSLESGNLIDAGNAVGQTIYDSYVIASTVTGATALTAKAITATNNFVTANNFRSPLVFQFEGTRLNSGLPLDQVKPQNPVVPKAKATHITPEAPSSSQSSSVYYSAHNVNAQVALNKKVRALQKAQTQAETIEALPDGRIRYKTKEIPSRNEGQTRGASHVTEYNPVTGQVRCWYECYDHAGNVNRVHPKMIDGQDILGQHYPPTIIELESWLKKFGGPQ